MVEPADIVLGIESTCDETSAAVVQSGRTILSHIIASQATIHSVFGGVVPELASRHHIETIIPVLDQAMRKAELSWCDLDLIAVAKGPGLIGSLLVGIDTAKALSWSIQKPLVGVNHIEAHLYASMMGLPSISTLLPALGIILSGGHTTILTIDGIGSYKLIGQTIDDAAGEAFDKVGSMLQLGYPGGPVVEERAKKGDPLAFSWNAGKVKGEPYHFSFSGLKTAVLYSIRDLQKQGPLSEQIVCDICASFQQAVVQDLTKKISMACSQYAPKALFLGGGVTQNQTLRQSLERGIELPIFWPPGELCLDNAAMIAGLGYHVYNRTQTDECFSVTPETRVSFA